MSQNPARRTADLLTDLWRLRDREDSGRLSASDAASAKKIEDELWRRGRRNRAFFHVAETVNRASILEHGLEPSLGWPSGPGSYVTTDPEGWLFLFDDGIYRVSETQKRTVSADIWAVDVAGYDLLPDTHETATPGEDFLVTKGVPPARLRLDRTVDWSSGETVVTKHGKRRQNPHAPGRWFHGTSLESAEKILAAGHVEAPKGMPPHYKGRGAKWLEPVAGLVYVTNDIELGLTYAQIRAFRGRGKYGPGALIEVDVEEPCLPDEDELGMAVSYVLHDEWKDIQTASRAQRPLDAKDKATSELGHAVLAAVPPALRARWEKAPERGMGGWSIARKAKEGKVALAVLPAEMIARLASMTRSIGCRGARVVRAWSVPPDYWKRRNVLTDEERRRVDRSATDPPRMVLFDEYWAARRRGHERLLEELPPLRAREENPAVGNIYLGRRFRSPQEVELFDAASASPRFGAAFAQALRMRELDARERHLRARRPRSKNPII